MNENTELPKINEEPAEELSENLNEEQLNQVGGGSLAGPLARTAHACAPSLTGILPEQK